MYFPQQEHAQPALADAAAHGQRQGAVQQQLVEGQFRPLGATRQVQLAAQASASTRMPMLESSSAQPSGLCQNRISQFSVQSS